MEHSSEFELLAFLDQELSQAERDRVEEHLRSCTRCAEVLDGWRQSTETVSRAVGILDVPAPVLSAAQLEERLVAKALGELDGPAPEVTADEVRRKAGQPAEASEISVVTPLRRERSSRRPLLAAALIIMFVAGAGAAIPGSPVREWLLRSFDVVTGTSEEPVGVPTPADGAGPSAISVQPRDGVVRILITEPAPETLIRLRLLDKGPASVFSVDGRYRTAPGEIEVLDAGPGEVVVLLPKSTPLARVELNGHLVAVKEGPDLKLLIPAADSSDAEVSFRARD
jgi:hypothetical protein